MLGTSDYDNFQTFLSLHNQCNFLEAVYAGK
jgi:hypothetical protein